MATTINNTANTATNASTTIIATLKDIAQKRIVVRNENRDLIAEIYGEALALPNPPLSILLPNGQPILSGWSPSLVTLSSFFHAYTKGKLGDTDEARREARELALKMIKAYIPYAIVVHGIVENGKLTNIITNFKSTLSSVRETVVESIKDTDISDIMDLVDLDNVKFYDFDKRGHWVGNQFLPSTTSTATTFAIPPTEDIA